MTSGSQRIEALERVRSEIAAFDWENLTDGRRRVLEAFLRIATTSGYSGVTMRELGRQTNMKAPSVYSHFPKGRDEVVSETLRWRYFLFAESVIEALDQTSDATEFWTALIDQHVRRQLQTLENDMFDLMLATDRISQFLPADTREEINHLVGLDAALFVGAAADLGYTGDVTGAVAVIITILDGVRSWSGWDGNPESLNDIVDSAVQLAVSILQTRASLSPTAGVR